MADVTPDVVAPPPGHPRFPGMDALRAVAAIAVLVSHVGAAAQLSQHGVGGALIGQGITGVTIFFVLSGFLLYRPFLAAQLDELRPVRPLDFARRRVLRIIPAYWLALTVVALWLHIHGVFSHDWWRYYFLLQNYSAHTVGGGLVLAWTLCVEASFYLLLPFYAAALARATRGRSRKTRIRLELAVLAVLGLASLGLYYASRAGDLSSTLYLTLPTTFMWFALGMALAVVSVGPVAPRIVAFVGGYPGWCWLAAGALYFVMSFVLRDYSSYSADQWTFQFVISALVAIALVAPAALGHESGGWPRRLLAWRPLALLGLVSYGIYLWQTAWIDQVSRWDVHGFVGLVAAALGLTIAAAIVSYVFLERPLMRFKNPRRTTEPPATRDTAAVPVSGRAPVPDSAPGSRR